MSAPSGYRIADFDSDTYAQNAEVFAEDVTFTEFPADIVIEIQIQVVTDAAVIIEISPDGGTTWNPVNNNETILGVATFTIFVQSTTQLNFRTPTTGGFTGSVAVVV